MAEVDAGRSGTFAIGGEVKIHRLGFGAMRITGAGIWGPPADRAEALRTLRRLPEIGVNFIDTADSYGPDVSEELIHEALHPYKGCSSRPRRGSHVPAPIAGRRTARPITCARKRSRVSRSSVSSESISAVAPDRPESAARSAIRAGPVAAR